jgi:secondary thiamine-phosphate synthase enzyme
MAKDSRLDTSRLPARHSTHSLFVTPKKQGLHEVTDDIAAWIVDQPIRDGLLTVFIRHTSASLPIQENVDSDVMRDIENFLMKLVPEELSLYRHIAEGPDDMPAHIKGALTQTHLAIPVNDGCMMLGTYQGVFVFEHRRMPRKRELVLGMIGQ